MYSKPARVTLWLPVLMIASSVTAQEAQQSVPDEAVKHGFESFDYAATFGVLLNNSGGIGFSQSWRPAGYNAGMPEAYRIVRGSLSSLAPEDSDAYVRIGTLPPRPKVAQSQPALGEYLEELRERNLFVRPGETSTPAVRNLYRRKRHYSIRGIGRPLADPIEADETVTLYFATLFRPDGELGRYIGFYLDGTAHEDLFIGAAGDTQKYRMARRGGRGKVMSDVSAVSGQVDLLVLKAEFQPGPDVFTLFINPDTRAAEPDSETVKSDLDVGRVNQIVLYSQGAFSMDDFRIVQEFADLNAHYPSRETLRQIPPAPPLEPLPPTIVRDDFNNGLNLDWQVRNEDKTHVSLKKNPGSLTITTQPGGFYGAHDDFQNLYLVPSPAKPWDDLELTTCLLGFNPKAGFQQAGLLCFDDEDNYIRWSLEWNGARRQQVLAVTRETLGRPAQHTYVDEFQTGPKLWLRLTKRDNRYTYSSSIDGNEFTSHGTLPWGDGAPAMVGLFGSSGSDAAPEIDAVFDYIEASSRDTSSIVVDQTRD